MFTNKRQRIAPRLIFALFLNVLHTLGAKESERYGTEWGESGVLRCGRGGACPRGSWIRFRNQWSTHSVHGTLSVAGGAVLAESARGHRSRTDEGVPAIFVTNQPDLGHGLIPPDEFGRIMEDLREKMGVGEEFVFFCPHVPSGGCACRKPSPGMIVDAADRFGIDLSQSFMMGDMETDIDAGINAGVGRTIRIVSDRVGESAADFMARNVFEAVEKWVRPGASMSPVPSMCRCKRSFRDPSWPK